MPTIPNRLRSFFQSYPGCLFETSTHCLLPYRLAKGTLRSIVRCAGLMMEESSVLL